MEIGKSWDDNPWVWVVKFSRIPGPLKGKKERPILLSTPMVEAILEGRKTQTRRALKPQPDLMVDDPAHPLKHVPCIFKKGMAASIPCPYGQAGDILWVRESWAVTGTEYMYKVDKQPHIQGIIKWKPSIFMPKKASRIWLHVEDIRVERLQDISEADAKSEGVEPVKLPGYSTLYRDYRGTPGHWVFAGASFRTLWISLNG